MIEVEGIVHPGGQFVIVRQCPFCGSTHEHGRGDGTVMSHCRGPWGGSYYIREGRQLSWAELDRFRYKRPRNTCRA